MVFRFASGLVLIVLVSLAGTSAEKQNLRLRRQLSRQCYRSDVLQERLAKLRLRVEQLGAPARLIDALDQGRLKLRPPDSPEPAEPMTQESPAKRAASEAMAARHDRSDNRLPNRGLPPNSMPRNQTRDSSDRR